MSRVLKAGRDVLAGAAPDLAAAFAVAPDFVATLGAAAFMAAGFWAVGFAAAGFEVAFFCVFAGFFTAGRAVFAAAFLVVVAMAYTLAGIARCG